MITPNSAESIFVAALEKTDSAARASYLDEACKGNDGLRREVERLLEAHPRVGGFLEQPIASNLADELSAERTNADSDVQARKQLDETQAEANSSAAIDEQVVFLTPSQKPGSLGRLDHYEILEVVGKGGFGIVLKAFDEKLHRVVAIKALSPELTASGTARQRFIREARTAAAVTHEHVVTIHAVVEEHRPPYLVMQMIDGVTLQQKLDKAGTLSLREVLRIGMQMAEGLAAAHKQGLVHRDIKPANILLENGIERVKITDFGLARAVDDASVTQSGTVAGTPMYMSPEQANGEQIDHRSDLFSLGTVLYAMCTGRPPFRASSTMAVLKRVSDASPRPIREINNEIPDWLSDIIGKLHAKKPEERFQTAKEVAELLGQRLADVQAGRAIEGRAEGRKVPVDSPSTETINRPPTGLAPPTRRRSWLAWVGLITLAVIGVWFTLVGAMLVVTPQSALTEQGRLSAPILLVGGPSILCWMVFFGARRSWLRWLAGASAVLLGLAALFSPLVYQSIFPLPPSMAQLVVQTNALNVRVAVIPLDDPERQFDFPPQQVVGVLLDKQVPIGNWRVIAYQGDKLHYQTEFALLANVQKFVTIPESPTVDPSAVEPGWVQLFNGKDLTGWKTHPTQPGNWRVDANHLVSNGAPGYLFSEKGDWQDFHLRAEVHIVEGGNSGIFFRTNFELATVGKPGENRYAPKGWYEADVFWAAVAKPGRIQNLAETTETLAQPNQWMTLEIIAQGNRLITRVNGKTAVDVVDSKSLFSSGHLALQAFTPATSVRFRKIEIKELPPEEPGWVQLFNGEDTTGWNTFPAESNDAWQVADGILKGVTKADQTYLWTARKDFRDFHLKVEARLPVASDCGIIFRDGRDSKGYEAEIHASSKVATGSLWQRTSPKMKLLASAPASSTPKIGDWFTMEVIARGSRLHVLVNGNTMADVTEPTSTAGSIGLQCRGANGSIEFRKIEIKELPPEERSDTWNLVRTLEGHKKPVDDVVYLPDGKTLASASSEGLKLWSVDEGKELTTLGKGLDFSSVAISVSGQLAAAGRSDGTIHLFDLENRKPVGELAGHANGKQLNALDFSADGTLLLSRARDKKILVWNVAERKIIGESKPAAEIGEACFIPRSTDLLATGGNWIARFDSKGDTKNSKQVLSGTAFSLAVAPDGRLAAVGGWSGKIDVVDVATLEVVSRFSCDQRVVSLAFLPDGRLVSGSFDRTLRLWDPRTGKEIARHTLATHGVNYVAVRPDGGQVATGGGLYPTKDTRYAGDGDYAIRLWRLPQLSSEPGWVQLFNGKDASAWTMLPPDTWKLKDGVLTGQGRTHLWSQKRYRDVHCRAEVLIDADTAGMLAVRHIDARGAAGNLGIFKEKRKTGSLTQMDAGGKTTVHVYSALDVKPKTWFVAEVIIRGNEMTVLVDGKEMARKTLADLPSDGHVGLGLVQGTLSLRKFEIKELPPEESQNYALSFDGADDYVVIPDLKYDGSHPITLEAWVKIPKVPDQAMTILGTDALRIGLSKEGRWIGYVHDEPPQGKLPYRTVNSLTPPVPGEWTHVALVLFGREGRLFVDGKLSPSRALLRSDHVPSKASFFIGASRTATGYDRGFVGDIDALRISKNARYDRDFTPDKLKADENTIALYDVNEGKGDVVNDSSGNKRHGQIVGAQWLLVEGTRVPIGEWGSYFNGKDMNRWRVLGPGKGDWQVRDGHLIGTGGENGKYLFSDRLDWSRFHLRMEAKLKGTGEVWYHIHNNDWKGGFEVIHYGKPDSLSGAIRTPIDPNLHPSIKTVNFAADSWFNLEIISDGPRLITKTNGVVTADVTLTPEQQKKWYKEGVISIGCGSNGEWTIRKIEIKELSPKETARAVWSVVNPHMDTKVDHDDKSASPAGLLPSRLLTTAGGSFSSTSIA